MPLSFGAASIGAASIGGDHHKWQGAATPLYSGRTVPGPTLRGGERVPFPAVLNLAHPSGDVGSRFFVFWHAVMNFGVVNVGKQAVP